jgi:hypothetical protein
MPDVEQRLRDLAPTVDWPAPAPDLPDRVLAALPPRQRSRSGQLGRPGLLAAAAVVVVVVIGVLAVPGARRAVADWLGVTAVRITLGDEREPTEPLGEALDLGEQVRPDDLPFAVPVPAALGEADEAWRRGDREVSLVWRLARGPVVLTYLRDRSPALLKAAGEAEVQAVEVGGARGWWVAGDHTVRREGEDGSAAAGSVLLWDDRTLTYRLEGVLSREDALRVAESLR